MVPEGPNPCWIPEGSANLQLHKDGLLSERLHYKNFVVTVLIYFFGTKRKSVSLDGWQPENAEQKGNDGVMSYLGDPIYTTHRCL